jgi:UDP-N-acetylenolpyruvoylglucosamine reductase
MSDTSRIDIIINKPDKGHEVMADRRVINKEGRIIDEEAVSGFGAALQGRLVRPGDETYDTARKIWNGMINKFPSLITYCADETDVVSAVRFAGENDLLVAVRSGGHTVAGNAVCNGGMVIDLSDMKQIDVDTSSSTADVQAGLRLGELDRGTQAYGLATSLGIVSKTGIAGLTLGGGIGWLMRRYGLTCDNLLSVDIVTADGSMITANASENADLFWGVRGGGGNFGIATRFKYKLHPVKDVLGGTLYYSIGKENDLFKTYRDYISTAPDELATMLAFLITAPPLLPAFPRGTTVAAIHVCYTGDLERGVEILSPLRELGPLIGDTIRVMPFIELQSMLDAGAPPGLLNYWKSAYLASLDDNVIETISVYLTQMPSPLTQIHVQHLQGAVSRVKEEETAFSHRNALCALNIVSKWKDPDDSEINIEWTRDLAAALEPFSTGAYVNFMGDEGPERVRAAYSPAGYSRLVALKNKYDPTNFFSLNQNIKPSV